MHGISYDNRLCNKLIGWKVFSGHFRYSNHIYIFYFVCQQFHCPISYAGQQYDKDGIFTPWWTNNSVENFIEKQGCFETQYSQYEIFGYHVCISLNNCNHSTHTSAVTRTMLFHEFCSLYACM